MGILLTRNDFRESVFKRDGHTCLFCNNAAKDCHHIIDRKQFSDGGYYINNGASLCEKHHIEAEQSILSCEDIRKAAGITEIVLPEGFDPLLAYDKWGKEIHKSGKYPRSLHAQISLGTTSDDRFMPDGYIESFSKMRELVLTEKLDGQGCCFNKYGVFARSHTSPSVHPWDRPMWNRWELFKNDLKGLEIFVESVYAIHSIAYSKLDSYCYVFAIRENGVWKSWEEVKFYSSFLDLPTVPEIPITTKLIYKENTNENVQLTNWLTSNLGMTWEKYVDTPGNIGGFDAISKKPACEGLVIRNSDAFSTNALYLLFFP